MITFDVTINSGLPAGTTSISNGAQLAFDLFRLPAVNTIEVRASIGNFVWDDLNRNGIQNGGEPGLNGVTVRLLDSGGVVVATTTTNASGAYSFSNLAAGTYAVEFVAPVGRFFSPQDRGTDDNLDSDANPATGRTASFTLSAGQANNSIDAGLLLPA